MTILMEPDVLTRDSIRDAIGNGVDPVTDFDQLAVRVRDDAALATVIFGPNVDLGLALEFAERMRRTNPTLGIVLVRRRIDAALLTQAIRAGMREVIGERDLRGLREAVARNRAFTLALRNEGETAVRPGSRASAGHLYTVFSPKGGVGKTTFATNVGVVLAQRGHSVLVIDLDLAFGDVPIFLGIRPEHTFEELLDMGERLDAAALRRLVSVHESGLHVLAPPGDPGVTEHVRTSTVEHLLRVAVSEYEYVIVDTAPNMDERSITVMENSERVFVLTTLDIPSLKNIKIALETLRLVNFPVDRLQVVMNRADSKVGLDVREVEKSLGAPVTGYIPSSRLVPAATNRGVAVVTDQPRSPVAQAFVSFVAHDILSESAGEHRRTGLFSRRTTS